MPIGELNSILKNVENYYWIVVQNGYFIPEYDPNVTTSNYLTNVLKGTYYAPMTNELKKTGV